MCRAAARHRAFSASGFILGVEGWIVPRCSSEEFGSIHEISANQYLYLCWNYDSFGNRLAQVISGTPCSNPAPTVSYDANNRIQGQQYDAARNMTRDEANEYLYDGEGRICAVKYPIPTLPGMAGMVGYIYDAEGRRIAKASSLRSVAT
jgi:hypothetical protein